MLAARDVWAGFPVDDVAGELADLAAATLEAALAVARAELPKDAPAVRLAIIGLGKCGGRELNYVSDVDVVYVAEPTAGVDERQPCERRISSLPLLPGSAPPRLRRARSGRWTPGCAPRAEPDL